MGKDLRVKERAEKGRGVKDLVRKRPWEDKTGMEKTVVEKTVVEKTEGGERPGEGKTGGRKTVGKYWGEEDIVPSRTQL